MRLSDLRVYGKFLSRNKLYTLVTVLGFAVSLMFVITLGLYVKDQLSVDSFQENKGRIFLMAHDGSPVFGNNVAPYIMENLPEVETFVRIDGQSVDIGKGSEKVQAKALYADSTFFKVFSFPLIEGDSSTVLQMPRSVVLTESFSNSYYPDINPIGATLVIYNMEYTVTGIMKDLPQNTMLYEADFIADYSAVVEDDNFAYVPFLLAKKGSDLRAKTPIMLELLKKEIWLYKDGHTSDLQLHSLQEAYFKTNTKGWNDGVKNNNLTLVSIYAGIAVLVLIIALLNYINLTVAQVAFRGKEAATKKLMGCSRKRLIGQLFGESLIMSASTFAIGLFLAFTTEPFFKNVLNTQSNLADQFTVPVILAMVLFVVFIAVVAGLFPALLMSSFKPIEVVKGTFTRKVKASYSKVLIVFQYTIAIVLLICSFFAKEQYDYMVNYDRGYNREGILEIYNRIPFEKMDGLKAKLYSIPGVDLVSFSRGSLSSGGDNLYYESNGQQFGIQRFKIDSTFFEMYGISVVEPTGVTPTHDTYWVSREAYHALNPDTVTYMADFEWGRKHQIAGILSDFKTEADYNKSPLVRMSYLNIDSDWETPWNTSIKLAAGTDYFKTARLIEKEFFAYFDWEYTIVAKFIDEKIQQKYETEQKTSTIMMAFTILTIVIMIMGVFAMSMYMIRQKRKEISLRKVNGATIGQVLLMLNVESLKRVLIAFVVACPVAYYAADKWLESYSYRISLDWWVFVQAGGIVLLLTLLSVSWMTWRAARANPIDFLRAE